MSSKRKLEKRMDELEEKFNHLGSMVFEVHNPYTLSRLMSLEYMVKMYMGEDESFKGAIVVDYARTRGEYDKHKPDNNAENENLNKKLKQKMETIEWTYKFLYNEDVSEGIINKYITMLDENKERKN